MKLNKQEMTGGTKITLIISGAAMLAGIVIVVLVAAVIFGGVSQVPQVEAIERGADIWKLYAIAARAAIGRAKTVPAESYQDVYAQIEADMEQQIEEVAKEAEAE